MKSVVRDSRQLVTRRLVGMRMAVACASVALFMAATSLAWGGHRHHGGGYCGPAVRYCPPVVRHHGGGWPAYSCYRGPYTQWSCRPPIAWRSPCFYPTFSGCLPFRPWCGIGFPQGCTTYYWSTSTFLNVRPVGVQPWFAAGPAIGPPAGVAPLGGIDPLDGIVAAPPQADPFLVARLNQPLRVASSAAVVRPAASRPAAAPFAVTRPATGQAMASSVASTAKSDLPRRPSSETARRRAEKFVQQGDDLFRRGRHFEALSLYQNAHSATPDLPEPSIREGFAYLAVRRYDRAAAAFQRGMAVDSRYLSEQFRLSDLYGEDAAEQKSAHVESLAQAALERPEQAELVYLTGMFLLADGQPQRAETFLARAREVADGVDGGDVVQVASRP